MKQTIGNLLLVLGTVLGGIGAANSVRPWKWLELGDGAAPAEQFLFRAVVVEASGAEAPEELGSPGAPLDAGLLGRLRAAGIGRVQVKDPPRDTRTLPVDPSDPGALEGNLLGEDVILGTDEREVAAGREVTASLLRDLQAGGVAGVRVEPEGDDPGATLPVSGEDDEEAAAALRGRVLADSVRFELPEVAEAGAFIDGSLAERIAATGRTEVAIRVTRPFRWSDWSLRYAFLGAVLLMIAGVALKRGAATAVPVGGHAPGTAAADHLRELLTRLESSVAELAERADRLQPEEIHAELDPLLLEFVYPFVEGRDALRAAYGTAGFARILGSFAAGERKLNRAWSSAVDGYPEEARSCLREAVPLLHEALEAFPA